MSRVCKHWRETWNIISLWSVVATFKTNYVTLKPTKASATFYEACFFVICMWRWQIRFVIFVQFNFRINVTEIHCRQSIGKKTLARTFASTDLLTNSKPRLRAQHYLSSYTLLHLSLIHILSKWWNDRPVWH